MTSARPFFFAWPVLYSAAMRITAIALLVAACNQDQPVPTAAQNSDLDEAENLLDAAENNLAAIDTGALEGNEP